MLFLEDLDLRWHSKSIELCFCARSEWLRGGAIFGQCSISFDHEGFHLHDLQGIAGELNKVVTLESLLVGRQVRVRVLLHNARFTVVGSRVGIQISQILRHVFSLAQVPDSCLHFRVLAHKVVSTGPVCVQVRIFVAGAERVRRLDVLRSLSLGLLFLLLLDLTL